MLIVRWLTRVPVIMFAWSRALAGETLVLRTGDGREIPVRSFPVIIGRGANVDVEFPEGRLRPRHLQVRQVNGRLIVESLCQEMVAVNGAAAKTHYFEAGDVIEFGRPKQSFTITATAAHANESNKAGDESSAKPDNAMGAQGRSVLALATGLVVIFAVLFILQRPAAEPSKEVELAGVTTEKPSDTPDSMRDVDSGQEKPDTPGSGIVDPPVPEVFPDPQDYLVELGAVIPHEDGTNDELVCAAGILVDEHHVLALSAYHELFANMSPPCAFVQGEAFELELKAEPPDGNSPLVLLVSKRQLARRINLSGATSPSNAEEILDRSNNFEPAYKSFVDTSGHSVTAYVRRDRYWGVRTFSGPSLLKGTSETDFALGDLKASHSGLLFDMKTNRILGLGIVDGKLLSGDQLMSWLAVHKLDE